MCVNVILAKNVAAWCLDPEGCDAVIPSQVPPSLHPKSGYVHYVPTQVTSTVLGWKEGRSPPFDLQVSWMCT